MERPDWGHSTDLEDVTGRVAIVGIGESAYTKASGRTAREIGAEAAERAIDDAGLEPSDVDGLTWNRRVRRLRRRRVPRALRHRHELWTSQWGGGMTWAGTAPHLAAKAIEAGKATHVVNVFAVAWATQRGSMTGGPGETHAAQPLKQNLEVPFGWFPQPVYFATIMRRHMLEFGTTEEQFGAVAVACRRHANLHPEAVMHDKPMTLEDYLASPVLADPFRMLDWCLISDGGGAYVTTSVDRARDLRSRRRSWPAWGRAPHVGRPLEPAGRLHVDAPGVRGAAAFAMAGLDPADVDVLTCTTRSRSCRIMQIEDMGFCPKGERAVRRGGRAAPSTGPAALQHPRRVPSHAYVLGIAHVVELCASSGAGAAQVPDARSASTAGTRAAGVHADPEPVTRMALMRADFPLPELDERTPGSSPAPRAASRAPALRRVHRLVWYPAEECPALRRRLVHVDAGERPGSGVHVDGRAAGVPARVRGDGAVRHRAGRAREDPAVRIVSYLVDCDPAALVADLPVEAVFRPLSSRPCPTGACPSPCSCRRGRTSEAVVIYDGLRVVDLRRGIAGGYCSKLLTDLGADVVKLEPPDGDPLRRYSATGSVGKDGTRTACSSAISTRRSARRSPRTVRCGHGSTPPTS